MKMYKNYLEELHEGKSCVHDEKGFASYMISGDECYIEDIYVKKEFRQAYCASNYADEIAVIAKEAGCKYLTGSVACSNKTPERSIKVLLGYGFKLHSASSDAIYFIKTL